MAIQSILSPAFFSKPIESPHGDSSGLYIASSNQAALSAVGTEPADSDPSSDASTPQTIVGILRENFSKKLNQNDPLTDSLLDDQVTPRTLLRDFSSEDSESLLSESILVPDGSTTTLHFLKSFSDAIQEIDSAQKASSPSPPLTAEEQNFFIRLFVYLGYCAVEAKQPADTSALSIYQLSLQSIESSKASLIRLLKKSAPSLVSDVLGRSELLLSAHFGNDIAKQTKLASYFQILSGYTPHDLEDTQLLIKSAESKHPTSEKRVTDLMRSNPAIKCDGGSTIPFRLAFFSLSEPGHPSNDKTTRSYFEKVVADFSRLSTEEKAALLGNPNYAQHMMKSIERRQTLQKQYEQFFQEAKAKLDDPFKPSGLFGKFKDKPSDSLSNAKQKTLESLLKAISPAGSKAGFLDDNTLSSALDQTENYTSYLQDGGQTRTEQAFFLALPLAKLANAEKYGNRNLPIDNYMYASVKQPQAALLAAMIEATRLRVEGEETLYSQMTLTAYNQGWLMTDAQGKVKRQWAMVGLMKEGDPIGGHDLREEIEADRETFSTKLLEDLANRADSKYLRALFEDEATASHVFQEIVENAKDDATAK